MKLAHAADAVLFGAVGGPKWDNNPFDKKPERGLLRLRKDLELFANLRPAICFDALKDASSLKPEIVSGLDILIIRELTGGVYFGEPRGIGTLNDGTRRAVDTQVYTTGEVQRIARVAFDLARLRSNKVRVGREVQRHAHRRAVAPGSARSCTTRNTATSSSAISSPTIAPCSWCGSRSSSTSSSPTICSATCCPTKRRRRPARSACCPRPRSARRTSAPEASRDCTSRSTARAPDIAGKGLANPFACILSLAMCLRYSFGRVDEAKLIEDAVENVLNDGLRTGDIMQPGHETGRHARDGRCRDRRAERAEQIATCRRKASSLRRP